MILIERLPEPEILSQRKKKWLETFLGKRANKPGQRPDSRQYGHIEIRATLRAMSFHKCFYCERKLSEGEDEVDHYIEVAEKPELAFEWGNLYLSCRDCNKKLTNKTIPVSDCLDPCDSSEDPGEHLTFDDEYIRAYDGSLRGQKTIQKYKLDSDRLNYPRAKQLQQFERVLRRIRERQLREKGRSLTAVEKEALARFKVRDHPFSLMFSVYLVKLNL